MNQYEIENETLELLKECKENEGTEGYAEKKVLSAPFEIQLCLLKKAYLSNCASYLHDGLALVQNERLRELTLKDGDLFIRDVLEMEAEVYNEHNIASYMGSFKTVILDALLGEENGDLKKKFMDNLPAVDFKVLNEIISEAKNEGEPLPYAVLFDFLHRLKLVEFHFREKSREIKDSCFDYLNGAWNNIYLQRDKEDFYEELLVEAKEFGNLETKNSSSLNYYPQEDVTALSASLNNKINETQLYDKAKFNLLYLGLYKYCQEKAPERLNEVLGFIACNQDMGGCKNLWLGAINEDDIADSLLKKSVRVNGQGRDIEYKIDMLAWCNAYRLFELGVPVTRNEQLMETTRQLKEEYLEVIPKEKIRYDETGALVIDQHWTQTLTKYHKRTWKSEVISVLSNFFNEIQDNSENKVSAMVESEELSNIISIKVGVKPGGIFKDEFIEKMMESVLTEKRILSYKTYFFEEDRKIHALLDEYLSYAHLEKNNSLKENLGKKEAIKRKF